MGRIVVGVDSSEGSNDALRWAAKEAEIRGAELEIVHVYEHSPSWLSYAHGEGMLTAEQMEAVRQDIETNRQQAANYAKAVAERMVGKLGITGKVIAIEGHRPAGVLVDHAKDADLLVVGSRGLGGFSGLLLGSVSQQCITHAKCPVVVIHPRGDAS